MVGNQLVADLELAQQHHGAARILGGDDVHVLEDLPSAGRHVPGVADGRRHDIELAGLCLFVHVYTLSLFLIMIYYNGLDRKQSIKSSFFEF